jgi:hypothetical protein
METANYLIVNVDKKEYIDPLALTGCRAIQNFCEFPVLSMAFLLLTHHSNDNDINTPKGKCVGRWVGDKIITTSLANTGRDRAGNNKIGNLYKVARERFDNITKLVSENITQYEKARFAVDENEHIEGDAVEVVDEKKKIQHVEVEEYDNVRFRVVYANGNRITIIEERNEHGLWVEKIGNMGRLAG